MSFSLVPVTERESCAHHVRPELHVEPELHGISLHSYFLVNTISTGMGVDVNVKILDSFATHVAPRVGLAAELRRPSYRLSHRLIPAGRKLFAPMSVQCVLNSSVNDV